MARGVTKNLQVVALCLLTGGAVAFALREPSAPEVSSMGPVESGVPRGAPEVPSRSEEARLVEARPGPSALEEEPAERPDAADVWCEGLSVERCGEYPQDCEAAVYCDGVRFCRAQERSRGQESCAGEGLHVGGRACCPGLVSRCGARLKDETCDSGEETSEPVCLRCGDGVCGVYEQACNCPEDCATSEARPKVHHRGLMPKGPPSELEKAATPGQCLDIHATAGGVHSCLESWSEALFGLSDADALPRVENLAPFTPFDIDLMRCLERWGSYAERRSETSREGCIEALYRRTQDARLDKLRWFSTLSEDSR
ncbi:hypothetical protein MYSTI_07772 [Myxococcus stipitatus DSM 14675]|uniref:Lipoprotein n=1 Tax=Myxococcus stipitatus (strain DSM 14675 / JCM 12634 / Mx s8) TaxID=1278073 RepID=L7UR42_MYXSD|nr:hypothetical protein [Myxococcus stipitatus]AGC49044.1 hypothetical protein MYSTI_07772 [Myxococcus stipitatus DSM 14675]